MTEDPRLQAIQATLMALAAGDLGARAPSSEEDDELEAVITSINMLGEELEATRQAELVLGRALERARRLEAVGTMASGIAHELNNVLAAVLGLAEVAQAELPEGHELRADVGAIAQAARRGRRLVKQLRAFARPPMDDGARAELNEAVRQHAAELQRTLPSGVELCLALAPEVDEVACDREQLEQILRDLGANAQDAVGPSGTITIATDVGDVDDADDLASVLAPGRYARLEVRDDGCGMDEDTSDHALEPFFTTKAPGRGAGLGLSAAYGIAHSRGGTLQLTSTEGKGTTVVVLLPLPAVGGGARGQSQGGLR